VHLQSRAFPRQSLCFELDEGRYSVERTFVDPKTRDPDAVTCRYCREIMGRSSMYNHLKGALQQSKKGENSE
jgi:hypothetical protein